MTEEQQESFDLPTEEELEVIDPASDLTKLAAQTQAVAEMLSAVVPGTPVRPSWGPVIRQFRRPFFLAPPLWARYAGPHDIVWECVDFAESELKKVPLDKVGVYGILIESAIQIPPHGGYLIYVGMTDHQSLQIRFDQHLKKLHKIDWDQYKLTVAIRMWKNHLRFCYAPVDDPDDVKAIESELLTCHLPPCNTRYPAGVQSMMTNIWGDAT